MGEVTAPLTPPAKGAKSQSFLRDLVRRLIRERPVGAVSAAIIVLLCLVAIFADVLAPFHFMDMTMIDRLQGPSSTYPLGTDHIGRGVLSRLLYGARVSLGVGFAATTLSVLVSLLIGGVAGFVGGKLDLAVQRFVDAWVSFPGLLLLLTFMTIIGQGIPQIIGMLALASGVANSRVVRGAVIGIKGNPYFEAAHAIGSPSWRTLLRHVWPNITAPIIIIYSITIGWAIIAEASLSFLGFGLPPDVPSWGTMLSREGAAVHGDGAAAGDLAGGGADVGSVLPEHGRRRAARPARPALARRRLAGRRSRRPRRRARHQGPAEAGTIPLSSTAGAVCRSETADGPAQSTTRYRFPGSIPADSTLSIDGTILAVSCSRLLTDERRITARSYRGKCCWCCMF